ncbi:MAG: 2-C-methyl-D-erythritol 4-phosphate cytidylyltransferase [Lachnospiraceae bacterium]|nr:2-C-methyl-D-erythritol 4-phosphate cytidylyltransferase [Lachnospiraceae bacterium]
MTLFHKKKKIAALILAAGKGTRFGGELPKQFLPLDEVPMLLYSVDVLSPLVDRVFLVVSEDETARAEQILTDAGLGRSVSVLTGGKERYESSMSGLNALIAEGGYEYVLIHDAARCLITEDVVLRMIEGVRKDGAVIAAVPSKDTVKIVDPECRIISTPDRKTCYQVQTPQAFRVDLLKKAYDEAEKTGGLSSLTDDASAVERFTDHKVRVVLGSEENFKVTTPFDFMLAEAVLTARRLKREAEK